MGNDTTIVLRNDVIDQAFVDPNLGFKIRDVFSIWRGEPVEFQYGQVIETHHASELIPILVGGHTGHIIRNICLPAYDIPTELELVLLKALATKHQYKLIKKK